MSRTNPSKSQRNQTARAKAEEMRRQAEARSRRNRNIIVGVTVLVVAVIFVVVAVAWQSASREAAKNAAGPAGLSDRKGIVVGQDSAPVTVTAYTDFMCPACGQFEQENTAQLDQLRTEGKIKVEYVPVTILDRFSQGTQFSTRSAGAAFCVADTDRDKYVAFSEAMFANQPAENSSGMNNDRIAEIAAGVGVSDAGQQCIKDGRYNKFATAVTDQASKDGLGGTPYVLVNGEQVKDWSAPNLKAIIDAKGAQ